jgi:hypothetical protein
MGFASLPATNAKRLRKGAKATKQSILGAAKWIASLALAMTVLCAIILPDGQINAISVESFVQPLGEKYSDFQK